MIPSSYSRRACSSGVTRLVAAGEAGLALLAQPALGRLAGSGTGKCGIRSWPRGSSRSTISAIAARVAEGLGLVREEGRHLGRRLEVELGRLEAQPPGRVEVAARPDAEEDVVGLRLRLVHVVEVVGHHERQSRLRRQAEELRVQAALLRQPVVLQLQVEAVLARRCRRTRRPAAARAPSRRPRAPSGSRRRGRRTSRSAPRCIGPGARGRCAACSSTPRGARRSRAGTGCGSRRGSSRGATRWKGWASAFPSLSRIERRAT